MEPVVADENLMKTKVIGDRFSLVFFMSCYRLESSDRQGELKPEKSHSICRKVIINILKWKTRKTTLRRIEASWNKETVKVTAKMGSTHLIKNRAACLIR